MKQHKFKFHLSLLFILAVILPSFVLSFLAIRTVAHEEAFLEKRLQETLSAEITHAASLINAQLKVVQQNLDDIIAFPQDNNYRQVVALWTQKTDLIEMPFLLSSSYDILWPDLNQAVNAKGASFFKWSADFLNNKEATPVFKNIAFVYKDEILNASNVALPGQTWGTNDLSLRSTINKTPFKRPENDAFADQYSFGQFQQYEPIRKQVYDQARDEGQNISQRNIFLPQKISSVPKSKGQDIIERPEQSIFISESLNFSHITKEASSGMIPRFSGNKLNLLFWKKDPYGQIAGCVIDGRQLTNRILGVLPAMYSDARILTILDHNGRPIMMPDQDQARDWRRPFVATEISELLPRWEVVAYLTRPDAISSKARATEVYTWFLIFILLFSIITGGTLFLRSLSSEMRLAQQKTTFAANVSHELKTPLTSIRMFTEMLKDKRQPDEQKQQGYFDIMLSEIERLTRLINNVLDFSRMGRKDKHYQFKKINIVQLCKNILEGQRIRLEYHDFTVHFKNDADEITVDADEEAIKQIVLNLMSNAEKYSSDRKEIEIEVTRKNSRALINIKDRGSGVSPGETKLIFEEFYRGDDSLTSKTRGTGLGLTIAQRIARDHGGDILYFARERGGSIFQVSLPVA